MQSPEKMQTPEKILNEMDSILTELIVTAEKLINITSQVISKEELGALQESQNGIVKHLIGLDNAFKQAYKGQPTGKNKELRDSIEKKLDQFEKLNNSFIENLSSTHSVLQKRDIPRSK